jgi:cytochrome c553
MKLTLLFAASIAALAVSGFGQDEADYQKWMKTIGATSGSLRKNLEAKNADGAFTDAKKLQETFDQVHDFWSKKNVDDATKFAMGARDGFRDIAQQASAGKFDDAAATLKTTAANCAGCHKVHREKVADGWKIKP